MLLLRAATQISEEIRRGVVRRRVTHRNSCVRDTLAIVIAFVGWVSGRADFLLVMPGLDLTAVRFTGGRERRFPLPGGERDRVRRQDRNFAEGS